MAGQDKKRRAVSVRLLCAYVGEGVSFPGEVIEVDAEEAERLVAIGAAVIAGE